MHGLSKRLIKEYPHLSDVDIFGLFFTIIYFIYLNLCNRYFIFNIKLILKYLFYFYEDNL